MKFHIFILSALIVILSSFPAVFAQADSVIGQISNSTAETFAGGISGDGRFVVFESIGNIATENPRNADNNREIFLFDYAQRRIFQITDTRSLLINASNPPSFSNIRVVISNLRPVISNDGRFIAFGSNATTSTPIAPNNTNPGNFNAAAFTDAQAGNPLLIDGNTEMWLYAIPATAPVNLSLGSEIAPTDLSAGTFTPVTNSTASRLPAPGTATAGPSVADDNREASINDNGNYLAFVSTRDLVPNAPGGNASPNANDEIFSYVRNSNTINQITRTGRGTVAAPIYNQNPTISGNGLRIAFLSNADNPVVGMGGGSNADGNVEIFYTDLNAAGSPSAFANTTAVGRQITQTATTNPGDIVNIFDIGRRMSRDGRYIAFDSYADLANSSGGANLDSFALYLFDTTLTSNAFRQIGPRSNADAAAAGGDIAHYPGFTDYDNGIAQTLVFETRLNIRADGTVAATNADGLNPNTARPTQIYSYPLNVPSATATLRRLTNFPTPNTFIASVQPIPSNTLSRMTFNLALTEIGTGNPDLSSEAFYFLLPAVVSQSATIPSFRTGASGIPVSASPVPTPSPSATPSPSPTPQTPSAVQGVSPGMLAIVDYTSGAVTAQTAVGDIFRRFTLPIELSGVTVTINGAAAGIKSVGQNQIVFVVPPGLTAGTTNATVYPLVINNNGVVFRSNITIVPARPDIFTFLTVPGASGRAQIFNVTNRVRRTEPFSVSTRRVRGGTRVPTILRLFLTGVQGVPRSSITIRVGNRELTAAQILSDPILREPGVYSIDITLPPELAGAGDVPIIVSVLINGQRYESRLDDTAPRFRIL